MIKKSIIIITLLLLTKWSYSQSVLIDKQGDTLITITIPQMNSIYIELLQKDSLMAQSILSHSKEVLLYRLIDSTKKDVESLRVVVKAVDKENRALCLNNEIKTVKLKRNRIISIVAVSLATLLIIK
jgi:hypothetical protein